MLKNTGERLILDQSWNIMTTLEHMHRYNAATQFVKNKVVLDAACGTGYGTCILSNAAKEIYGIDLSEDALIYACEHYKNHNLHYLQMSVDKLDFDDGFFDTIISFETIEHITKEQQIAFLENIKKKLKKTGTLIISTPNDQLLRDLTYGAYTNEFHLCEFNEQEFIQFLKQYFKNVKIFYQTVTEASGIMSSEKENTGTAHPLFSMLSRNVMGRYYIAICSDEEIGEETTMESVLFPDPMAYFDERYFQKQMMLFVDSGNGFSDSGKILGTYVCRDGYSFHCEFSLEDYSKIHAIRFDPCEHGCKVTISSAYTDQGIINFDPVNASGRENQYDVFMTLDPQYICKSTLLNEAKILVVEGRINAIPDHIVIGSMDSENAKLKNQAKSLQEKLENAATEISNCQEYIRQLEANLASVAGAIDVVENQKTELNNYRKYVQQLEGDLADYHRIIDVIKNQKKEIDNYQKYVEQLEQKIIDCQNALDINENEEKS